MGQKGMLTGQNQMFPRNFHGQIYIHFHITATLLLLQYHQASGFNLRVIRESLCALLFKLTNPMVPMDFPHNTAKYICNVI